MIVSENEKNRCTSFSLKRWALKPAALVVIHQKNIY